MTKQKIMKTIKDIMKKHPNIVESIEIKWKHTGNTVKTNKNGK